MICYTFKRRRRVHGELVESREWFGALRMEWERGEPRKWCLHTTDKREAERLLHEERVKAEKRHHGMLPPAEYDEAKGRPLSELLEAFLGHLRSIGRAETTLKKYRNMRVMFARCGWKRIDDVSGRSFSEWRKRSDLSGESLNDLLRNTQNFFGWMRRGRMVKEEPLEFVEPIRVAVKQCRRALSPEQAQRLLAVASPQRAAVYLVAMQTGLRRCELQRLTVGDFALDAPKAFVRVRAAIAKGGKKDATIWLRDEVVAAIRSVWPDNPMPFERAFAGMVPRIPRFKKDLELAGIPFEDEQGRRVDLHALRVTFATNLSVAGVAPRVAQELMRHSDIRLTMKLYTDGSQLPTAAAVASLPALSIPGTHMGTQTGTQTGDAASPAVSQGVVGGRA